MTSKAGQFRNVGIWVVVVLVAATLASTWLALRQLERQTRGAVGNLLGGVAETSRSSMLLWYHLEAQRSNRLARDPSVAAAVQRLVATRTVGGGAERAQALAALDSIAARVRDPELRSYEVIGADSVVLGASVRSRIGRRSELATEYPELIARAFRDSVVVVPPGRGRDVASVAVRLHDLARPGRGALLALQYDADGTFSQVLGRGRPGISGEAYAVDRTGTLLTASRFLPDLQKGGVVPAGAQERRRIRIVEPGANIMGGERAATDLDAAPLTTMAAAVTARRSGADIDGYPDYRGVRVLGAWVWEPALQIGIASEMDETEALAGYRASRKIVLRALIGLAALIGVLVLTLVGFGTRAARGLRAARDEWERVANERLARIADLLVDAEKLGRTGGWEQDLVSGQILNSDASRHIFFGDDPSKGSRLEDYVEAIHPDDRERVQRSREALLAGTGSGDIEYRVIWPDGSVHVIFARATVVRDASARPINVYGVNADITERKRAEKELARRARQLEMLSRKLIEAQEAERRAVALELHDDLGQVLFGLKLSLQRSGRDESESIALVDGAIGRMRDLVQALRPPLLDEFGLPAALSSYVEREAKRAGLAFNLTVAPLEKRLPITVEVTCFRVAQEALTNVIRHAQARVVDIELSQSNNRLELIVRDDGQGFEVATARRRAAIGASHGLLSMQERVALVGGNFEIESAPGRGTSIRAHLPLVTPKPISSTGARQVRKRRRTTPRDG